MIIQSTFGITREPFSREHPTLLPAQQAILDIISIHAQHGGFSVIVGQPGVGKSVLRGYIEQLGERKENAVISISQTLHTYGKIIKQMALSMKIDAPEQQLEKELIQTAYKHIREQKTLYTLIDEAHLLDMPTLRKLRLLFDKFPHKHNLVLFGQPELLHALAMNVNADLKGRITYSANLLPLNEFDLEQYMMHELELVKLGVNTFDEGAIELILRNAQGNLRLCRNLCYGSLVEACRENKMTVMLRHVNNVLIQPHWRSHEQLIQQQVR